MKPTDLQAIRDAVRGELMIGLPPPPGVPADLDLEAGVIAARWDGATVPTWFVERYFYSDANRAIWCAVDAIVAAGHTPTPSLIRRASEAGGARVAEAERYALDIYARPVGLDVPAACVELRELARRREALAWVRAAERALLAGDDVAVRVRLESAMEAACTE